jgi:mRNA-degrading endonuclease RelE of RelBE toxin-antitoxin system
MQNSEPENIPKEVFFTHEFKRNLRQLAKKYRRIQADIQPILSDLQSGNLPGDQVPGTPIEIYKVRARNSDSAKGKSGGYRIIYQNTQENTIILITIYSKTEQSDISPQEIQAIVQAYAEEQASESTPLNDRPQEQETRGVTPTQEDVAKNNHEGDKA